MVYIEQARDFAKEEMERMKNENSNLRRAASADNYSNDPLIRKEPPTPSTIAQVHLP